MKRVKDPLKQFLVIILIVHMCTFTSPIHAADIIVDTTVPSGNRPTLDTAQNGVIIVNLSKPTSGGVSHNKFDNYNVGKDGVILNNSKDMGVSTLGGAVYGNPNFQSNGREASIVINEVTGLKRTDLVGATEMFGKSAEFVLVNSNGIMCNGAGFINMPRVTLATGKVVFDSDVFKKIDINGGSVLVEGKGIDAGKVNYFEIVTRVASINGGIWGRNVSITTGTGSYNYKDKTFSQKDTGTTSPEIGIDASALGSIYAGRITIVSNEKGVGVRSNGDMLADVSDIKISADGSLELKNVQAANNITVTSESAGILQCGDAFAMGNNEYTAGGIINSGSIKGVNGVTVNGLLDNETGLIASQGNIILNVNETINNKNGSIIMEGDNGTIYLRGVTDLDNTDGNIKSGDSIQIDMTDDITLNEKTGNIYADKNLQLNAVNVTNSKDFEMNGSININASGNLTADEGSTLKSINRISLNATGSILNRGVINGASDIVIKAGTVTNDTVQAEISTDGNLSIDANTVNNNGGQIISVGNMNIVSRRLENIDGYIYSMGNMNITKKADSGNSIYNYLGHIESDGDMTMDVGSDGTVENVGENYGSYSTNRVLYNSIPYIYPSVLETTYRSEGDLNGSGSEWLDYIIDGIGYSSVWKGFQSPIPYINGKNWSLMGTLNVTSAIQTNPSYIVSGNNLQITAGTVTNRGGVVSSVKDITFNTKNINNETSSRIETINNFYIYQKIDTVQDNKTMDPIYFIKTKYTSETVKIPSETPAIMQAGGNIIFNNSGGVIDNTGIVKTPGIISVVSGSVNNGNGYTPVSNNNKPTIKVFDTESIQQVINTGAINLTDYVQLDANGTAIFKIDKEPGSTYLIETRSSYIDVDKLKGSQYLFDRIGFNPDKDIPFLGDAFYEQKLVSESIIKATSQRYLEDSIKSDQDQMAWLLDNAASAYRDLNLAIGVDLTKEQINKLQQPIVWYVEEEIMGVRVLAPKIYIPEHIIAGFSKNNGSVISGGSVNIKTDGDITNSGIINSNTDLELTAHNNIINFGGTIKGKNNVSLTAETGDIKNETIVKTEKDISGNIASSISSAASIESGNSLKIHAGGNITNKGADVKSGGDAEITADGNIDFETVKLRNKTKGDDKVSDSTSSVGSALEVGGNFKLSSGRDTYFIGSTADIAGNADVKTGGNFNLLNDYDSTYSKETSSSSGLFSDRTTTVVDSSKKVVSSGFHAGGDLNVNSGNDINIYGSDISSGGDTTLKAIRDQNIVAVQDETYHKKTTSESGFGKGDSIFGSEKKSDMVSDKIVNGSSVDVKGNFASNSDRDTNITGSNVNVGGTAELTTGGDLNVKAVYNEHSEAHSTEKSGYGNTSGDFYAKEIDAKGNGSTTAAASVINADDLTVKSNNVLIEGSTVNAGSASFETTGSFTETSAKETSYEYSYHEKTTTGLDLGLELGNRENGGRTSLQLASGTLNSEKERTDYETQSSSNINITDTLTINSGKDITVAGSNINARGDVNLTAVDNISVETTQEKAESCKVVTEGTIEFTIGAKNAATDVYYAGVALKEANDAVDKAKSYYEDYKKSIEKAKDELEKKLIDEDEYNSLEKEKEIYLANIALAEVNLVQKTAALIKSTAGVATSMTTLGFSADAQLETDLTETIETSEFIKAKASNINVGDSFTAKAGNKVKIEGSTVTAGEDVILEAIKVEIIAAKDTNSSSNEKNHMNTTLSFSSSTGPGASAALDQTEGGSDGTTYINSHLNALNVTIKSTEDTKVSGGVVKAENKLTLDVDGNLIVESLQDKSSSNSQTFGGSAGFSSGPDAVVNASISNGSKSWVTEQTSLTGGVVDIDVEKKTTLTGAVIASNPSTGSGTGSLTFDTGSIEYSNLKDMDTSSTAGGGLNVSSNTGSLNGSYESGDRRQTNFATIGGGTVTVHDTSTGSVTGLEGLNRDVTLSQYNTKNAELKGGFTVDIATVDLVTSPVDTMIKTADAYVQGYKDGKETVIKVYDEAGVAVEKTGNLIEHDHFTTDGQLVYYDNIDEYNNLKITGGTITSTQELLYIGSRELIGDSLSNEELKDTALSYLEKRGDEYAVEGTTKGYFKNYDNILMFDYYLNQKLELINNGIDQIPLMESDKINLSRTLKQGDGEALSIQLQEGYGMTAKQANITETTSCKSGTIYWELKLSGAPVGTYSKYLDMNVYKGYIAESNGWVNEDTNVVVGQYKGYQSKIIKDYDEYKSGAGGEYGETRIVTKVVGDEEKKWHSIPTYSSDDGVVKIADTGDRGYGKSAEKKIEQKADNPQVYFKYYEYVEKKPVKTE